MPKSRYTILIVCEGKNTEPLFFNSINDELESDEFILRIHPEPPVETKNNRATEQSLLNHRKNRRIRTTKKAKSKPEPKGFTGRPPHSYVLFGQEQLKTGAYDEVWAVFDNDDHPAKFEAFRDAQKPINGKVVNIAYSSRSFEYYLLIHFEKIYQAFQKTECKEKLTTSGGKSKDVLINCGTNTNPDDCNGDICINGYARTKKYWRNSKGRESQYPLVKDNLSIGFERASWIRFLSDLIEGNKPVYDRNPYISVDLLVKRLFGLNKSSWQWVLNEGKVNNIQLRLIENKAIELTNIGKPTLIVPKDSFYYRLTKNNSKHIFGTREILIQDKPKLIQIPKNLKHLDIIGFEFDNQHILFETNINHYLTKSIAKNLVELTHKELSNLLEILRRKIDAAQ